MIRINNRYDIKNLLLKRSRLQEDYVKACAKTAERHETNYIRKSKKDYNLLTIWYFGLIVFVVILLIFYLNDALQHSMGKIIMLMLGLLLLGFLFLIIIRKSETRKLKKTWDIDLAAANSIRDQANKYGKEAAQLAIMIMALTEHNYLIKDLDLEKWERILYEYVDAINKHYNGASIDDYLEYYIKWENNYYKV